MLIATLVLASLAAPAQDCHQPTAGLGAHGVAWGPNGGTVYAMEVFDDGSGPALYVAGSFDATLGLPPNGIARWDGAGWSPVVSVTTQYAGFYGVTDMLVWDDGGGPALYFCGTFNKVQGQPAASIAKYTGSGWSTVGAGYSGSLASAMAAFDDGSGEKLFVAGWNWPSLQNVQVWDGACWSAVGGGVQFFPWSMNTFDDGGGTQLYAVGGSYASIPPAGWEIRAARWNGTAWDYLGAGLSADAHASTVFDDGSGPALFVGGNFTQAGGQRADHVARWTAAGWDEVYTSEGLVGPSEAMCVFDDGSGPALYAEGGGPELIAGGKFPTAGGQSISNLARWDGATWSAFSEPPNGRVDALQVFDDGSGAGPALFAGGRFDSLGSTVSMCTARWAPGCPCDPVVYCTAKVNSQGCTPSIYVTGSTSLTHNTLRVHATNVLNNKNGILFWGYGSQALPFQGGWLCIQPPIVRTTVQSSGGNPPPNDCSGSLHFHWNQPYVASMGLSLGAWYYTQYWSHDPASPSTTSLTDAARFLLCP